MFINVCRLTFVFLAFDVFFAIFCVVLACLIGIALCCCLPCIIALLYAVAGQVWTITVTLLEEMKAINCLLICVCVCLGGCIRSRSQHPSQVQVSHDEQ